MKSIIMCLAIITISVTFTVQTYAEIDLGTARGIWLLNEGEGDVINDISGNDNQGELQGGEWVEGPDGGPALSLNGQDDRVIISDSDSMYLEEAWTITAWTFVNNTENGFGHILGKRPASGTSGKLRIQNKRQRHRMGSLLCARRLERGLEPRKRKERYLAVYDRNL